MPDNVTTSGAEAALFGAEVIESPGRWEARAIAMAKHLVARTGFVMHTVRHPAIPGHSERQPGDPGRLPEIDVFGGSRPGGPLLGV